MLRLKALVLFVVTEDLLNVLLKGKCSGMGARAGYVLQYG